MECSECGSEAVRGHGGESQEVLYWSCMACDFAWPRDFESPYWKVIAQKHVRLHRQSAGVRP